MEKIVKHKKKIIRIISRLNIGGPAIHTILLSRELNKDGYSDVLVCGKISDCEGDMLYFAKENDVTPVIIPEMGRDISFKNDLVSFFKIYSLIKREKPDIVHTHTAKAGVLGRTAAVLAGVPVKVHTFHGHIFDGYFSPAKSKLFVLIERFFSIFTDRIILVSEKVMDEIVNKLKVARSNKCTVVRLGLDLDKFLNDGSAPGSFRKSIGASDETLLVGIVGRLVPIKNHKMFLDVVKKLRSSRPDLDVKFLVIGDGELRVPLQKYVRQLGLSGSVDFTGWVKDLSGVYRDLDVVALTSLNEGTPVSIIEALACARPVIATDVGGVKDLITDEENGYLVETNDADEFASRLLDLLNDKEKRAAFGRRGREAVRAKYSSQRLVRDITTLYEECLEKNGKPMEAELR